VRRTLVVNVVVVFERVVVDVAGTAVVGVGAVVVVGADVVVVCSTAPESRMAGSLLPWGTPAMATPTAAHTTSMSAVIERCPGLTVGPSRVRTLGVSVCHIADGVS